MAACVRALASDLPNVHAQHGPGWSLQFGLRFRQQALFSSLLGAKRPGHPETDILAPVLLVPRVDRHVKAVSRAELLRRREPGTASKHPGLSVTGQPRRAVRRRSRIAGVKAVLHPFPNIAMHLVEAKAIPLELVDRNHPFRVGDTRIRPFESVDEPFIGFIFVVGVAA
jgi:hypothetical protein